MIDWVAAEVGWVASVPLSTYRERPHGGRATATSLSCRGLFVEYGR